MHEFYESYYERLQTLHREIGAAIADLPPEALDWQPLPAMNSLTVLVMHVAGAERYWIGDVAGQDPSGRNRPAEFESRGLDLPALQERLEQTLAHSLAVLQRLALTDLDQPRLSPRNGETFSVGWALLHALEHSAIHLGHIHAGRDLWLADAAKSA